MTYTFALFLAIAAGISSYIATAAGPHSTATSAVPYGLGTAAAVAFFACSYVAYSAGQPKKR